MQSGKASLASGDVRAAQLAFTRVLAATGNEPDLHDLRQEADMLLASARAKLGDEEGIRQAADRFSQLMRSRDDALFYSSSFTGLDLAASLRATREAAHKGLALHGLGERDGRFDAGDFSGGRKEEIADACYELLLLLAEAVAQPQAVSPPLLKQRQANEALGWLAQAEKLGRSSQALLRRKVRYLEQAGRAAEAEPAQQAIAATPARTALDVFLIGDERLRQNKLAEASQDFEYVLRLKPDHFWAQYFLAISQLKQQRAPEARAHLTSCLGRRDFLWAYLLRGFACGEMKDFAAAEADYQQALARKPDALALYGLHVNRGFMRIRMKNFAGAVEDMEKAIALRPGDFQAYANLAEALQKQGKGKEALTQLNRAVQLKPEMPGLYRLRSGLRRELGDRGAALDDLGKAALSEASAKNGSALELASDRVAQAKLHLEAKRYPEAIAACELALKAAPDHAAAQRWKAEALLGLKRYAEAVDCFDRYLDRGKPVVEVYRARGLARAKLGRHPEAVDDLTSALRLKPDSELHAARGWIYLVCQAPRLAHHDFELAVKLEPQNADALGGRGYAAALLGRTLEAIGDAEKALQLGPETPRLVYNVARIFAQTSTGRTEHHARAIQLLQRALTLTPADQRAAFWKQYVLSDPALVNVRNGVGFTRLRNDLGLAASN